MADTHHDHVEDHDPTVHHEDRDINVRAVLWFAAIFVVVAVVIHVALYYLLVGFRVYENNREATPVTAVQYEPERMFPPQPRLQPFPEPVAAGQPVDAATESRESQEAAQLPGTFRNPWEDTPAADWKQYRATYDRRINGYGWVDQRNGVVHIPIEEAKRRLLAKGLASRPAVPVANATDPTQVVPLTGIAEPAPQTAGETAASQPGSPAVGQTTGGEEPNR